MQSRNDDKFENKKLNLMMSLYEIIGEDTQEHSPHLPHIPDHPHRMLIVASPGAK